METTDEVRLLKDPDAVLDYDWDWTAWLVGDDTISSHTVTVTRGDVTVDSSSHTTSAVKAWVSGGSAGELSAITAQVTTAAGRVDDRTIVLDVKNR